MAHRLLSFALFLLSSLPLAAQVQIVGGGWAALSRSHAGDRLQAFYGSSVAALGDLDGDGIGEYLVGVPGDGGNGLPRAGRIEIRSGATGAVLADLAGDQAGMQLGYSVAAAGDLDGDGLPEILAGAPYASGLAVAGGLLRVYRGADLGLLYEVEGASPMGGFGFAVDGLGGDVDGDAVPDLVVGAPFEAVQGQGQVGNVYVLSGADGSPIHVLPGPVGHMDWHGNAVAAAGDVDADGTVDLVVGATMASPVTGDGMEGAAYVYSGATGSLLHAWAGEAGGDMLGVSVAGAGDVDGDGHDDVLSGAYWTDPNGILGAGALYLYSGRTGEILWAGYGSAWGEELGWSVAGLGDVTGDGVPDWITGAPLSSEGGLWNGAAYLYSGADGSLAAVFLGEDPGGQFGYALAPAGDQDGDGLAEFLVASPHTDLGVLADAGRVRLFTFKPGLVCSEDSLSVTAGSSAAFQVDFPASEAGKPWRLLASFTQGTSWLAGLEIPLGWDTLLNRSLDGVFDAYVLGGTGVLDGDGDASASLALPPSFPPLAGLAGGELFFAALSWNGPSEASLASRATALAVLP